MIDQNGEHVGVMPTAAALEKARVAGLDLVEVATGAKPHVCRIMDYGHYKYEQAKRAKQAKKKQKVTTIKEVKLRPKISEHDYQFKVRNAQKFLEHGDKVKFVLMFRGREIAHTELGRSILERAEQELTEVASSEQKPRFEGRTMVMVMAPKVTKH